MTSFPSQQSICSSIDEYFRLHLFSFCETTGARHPRVIYSNIHEAVPPDTMQIEMALSEKREYIIC
jgi:hypothetical protein